MALTLYPEPAHRLKRTQADGRGGVSTVGWIRRYDMAQSSERATGLEFAESAIARGDLVVLPTDTVYGLGCGAVQSRGPARGRVVLPPARRGLRRGWCRVPPPRRRQAAGAQGPRAPPAGAGRERV